MNLFGHADVAIDLGRGASHVFARGRGIVFSGRTEGLLPATGGDADSATLTRKISECLAKAGLRRGMFRPEIRAVLIARHGIADVEKRALEDAARAAGAGKCFLVEEPVAAAIGAGLPVSEARGAMVVVICRDVVQVAVISLCGIVAERDVWASVATSASRGAAKKCEQPSEVPREAIAGAMNGVLADCAAKGRRNIVSDIMKCGAVIAGEGGDDEGLARWLSEKTGLPVKAASSPATVAVEGAGAALKELDVFARAASRLR